jgi:tRNA A-37 threonylcarbamoyl transferase component Bud32
MTKYTHLSGPEFVSAFYPSLVFEESYIDNRNKKVYRVSHRGLSAVLKASIGWKEIITEAKVLIRAQEIIRVPRLLIPPKHFGDCCAIVKSYIPGNILGFNNKINDPKLQNQLEETVEAFHALGISGLDIHEMNILLNPAEKYASICDFGGCYFFDEDPIKYHEGIKEDYESLDDIFSRKRILTTISGGILK